MKIYLLFWT